VHLVSSQTVQSRHHVLCPLCGTDFDLLSAPWCGCHRGHPSKICPRCERCLCHHPDYDRESLWRDAPAALRSRGFDKLFIYYL
jgi:predicted amidophosphoribosyltransferase